MQVKIGEIIAIKRFEDIEAWKAARELTQAIYRLTGRGKFAKDFGLPYGIWNITCSTGQA